MPEIRPVFVLARIRIPIHVFPSQMERCSAKLDAWTVGKLQDVNPDVPLIFDAAQRDLLNQSCSELQCVSSPQSIGPGPLR